MNFLVCKRASEVLRTKAQGLVPDIPAHLEEHSSIRLLFAKSTKRLVYSKGSKMEEQLRVAIIDELKRQAETDPELDVQHDADRLVVNGSIDLDALVIIVAGAVAGGP
jgi:hypothetical protein